jgi:hypothetical protein
LKNVAKLSVDIEFDVSFEKLDNLENFVNLQHVVEIVFPLGHVCDFSRLVIFQWAVRARPGERTRLTEASPPLLFKPMLFKSMTA